MKIKETVIALKKLDFISDAKLVGSITTGKKDIKDVDVLLQLSVSDVGLQSIRGMIKRDIVKILKKSSYRNWDLFLRTSDNIEWRLRPWEDEEGKISWDWE